VLVTLPILIPLIAAAISVLAWRRVVILQSLGILGTGLQLLSTIALVIAVDRDGIQVTQLGAWPAPYGISLVADHLSSLMALASSILGFTIAIYSREFIDAERQENAYFPLFQLMLAGVCGALLTGDIFNLYVWFEVLLVASFVLLTLGGERAQLEGGVKYVTMNLVSSFLFLIAIGILYGAVGSLNMADVAMRLESIDRQGVVATLSVLFLVAFGIKAAIFPLFFWLPASYHTPPAAVSAIFAGLLTKVGVYALIRMFTLVFPQDIFVTHRMLLVIAGLTMVTGVLGAMAQHEFRRILSFHIISQIGYMILGLGLFTSLGVAASIYFIVHNMFAKSNLFLVSGIAERYRGSGELDRLGSLYRAKPWLAILFAVPALSLAGIPPLSGFVGKLALVQAGLEAKEYAIVAVSLVVSLLTLYSMSKIWVNVFWKPLDSQSGESSAEIARQIAQQPMSLSLAGPVTVLAMLTAAMGLLAAPLLDFSNSAAHELLHPREPNGYIERVLGEQP
jgi:multicomponent Na+:H+ antiporter subunit D